MLEGNSLSYCSKSCSHRNVISRRAAGLPDSKSELSEVLSRRRDTGRFAFSGTVVNIGTRGEFSAFMDLAPSSDWNTACSSSSEMCCCSRWSKNSWRCSSPKRDWPNLDAVGFQQFNGRKKLRLFLFDREASRGTCFRKIENILGLSKITITKWQGNKGRVQITAKWSTFGDWAGYFERQ